MLARKAEREQKREDKMTAFKEKLETISDDKKKQIVERVNNRLNTVNENRITAWTQMLEKFSNILDRIQIKTNELKATGADVSTVESQITEAEAALATAQSALDAQAAKDYTITLSDESALRTDVVTMKDTLKTDLKTVHAALKSAHQAIREAAEALHQVQKPTDVGESEITE
jgi:DNA repair exonuclease SbcCD ATPase subunit